MRRCNRCNKPIPKDRGGWQCSEECRAKQRAYYQRPEVKAYTKAYMKAYSQRPENKAKRRELVAARQLRQEYHRLMLKAEDKKNPIEKWEIRRLEALAEFFGRDIEEWRTERMRREQEELQKVKP